jgi:hypothetical protein
MLFTSSNLACLTHNIDKECLEYPAISPPQNNFTMASPDDGLDNTMGVYKALDKSVSTI